MSVGCLLGLCLAKEGLVEFISNYGVEFRQENVRRQVSAKTRPPRNQISFGLLSRSRPCLSISILLFFSSPTKRSQRWSFRYYVEGEEGEKIGEDKMEAKKGNEDKERRKSGRAEERKSES